MNKIQTIYLKDKPNIIFKGKLIAESVPTILHYKLFIYKVYYTSNKNYLLYKCNTSKEDYSVEYKLSNNLHCDIYDFFGWNDSAKEIYSKLKKHGIYPYIDKIKEF